MQKTEEYEPLFIRDNKKIIFREIEQIDEKSCYYSFKNEQYKIYRMKQNERKFLDELGIDREFLNEMIEDDGNRIKKKLESEKIEIAEYIDETGEIEIYIQELNNRNFLEIRISNVVKAIKKEEKYFIPKINNELLEILEMTLGETAFTRISEENKNRYITDYEGLGIISEIIDERYSDKVKIRLDSNIKKARNVNVSFGIRKAHNNLLDFSFNIEGIESQDVDAVIGGIRNESSFLCTGCLNNL